MDTLIVLDEAHLVPPFADLLRAIEGQPSLWPKDRTPLPRFIVLPLSATQRERPAEENGRKPFGLEEEDWRDDAASQRLNARKQLRVEPLAEKDHDRQLAEAAFALATKGQPARVVVFCNRREKKDDGAGPSAQGVAEAIEALAMGTRRLDTRRSTSIRQNCLWASAACTSASKLRAGCKSWASRAMRSRPKGRHSLWPRLPARSASI